jgi:hypothetical protein
MTKVNLLVAPCSFEAAKYAVMNWHYSRNVPNQKLVKLGVWEDKSFIGTVLFGSGANSNIGEPYGLEQTEICELVRVALSNHVSPVTKIVSVALRQLKKSQHGLRLVVSYADTEQDHLGIIYQAGNWIYAGTTIPADEYIVNGTRMHGRALRSTRSTHKLKNTKSANVFEWAQKVLDPNIKRVSGSVKYRYLYPLDKEMRAQIQPLAKPYPKR